MTYLEWALMALLLVLSCLSFAIMIDRRRRFARELSASQLGELRQMIASMKSAADQAMLKTWIDAHPGVHSGTMRQVLLIGNGDARGERVDRAVRSYLSVERQRLDRGLAWLATLGANAPFIGLFGTVLGIIRSFAALGTAQGGTGSVMSGISQALYATAAGLFVAIPAVIAFNYFSQRTRDIILESDALKETLLARGDF